MKNLQIRAYAVEKCIKLWEIADSLNIADSQFSRMLRKELDDNTKNKIISIINNLSVRQGIGG